MAAKHCRDCTPILHDWQSPVPIQSTTLSPAYYAHNPAQRHNLCSLPPEIRERIWKFVFSVPPTFKSKPCEACGFTPIQGLRTVIQHAPDRAATKSVLTSLRTCKLLYTEAAHMFYSLNLLSLSSPAALYHFLTGLSPRQREGIAALHIANVSPTHWTTTQIAPQAFALLSLCPRLEDLYMDFCVEQDADARLGPLMQSIFANDEAFWTRTDFPSMAEYEEHLFCQGFLALSQQRNIVRFGLRARSDAAGSARPMKLHQQFGPYAYEDLMYKPVEGVAVDMLRERMQQARLKPATRLQRAQKAAMQRERQRGASARSGLEDGGEGLIRKLNPKEAMQEQNYLKQKSMIRTLFEHQVTPPCRRGDHNHF